MKLRKVISGGQTGADRTGLECAQVMGLETGGTAPKGYRTESGKDVTLKDFGLVESAYSAYQPRTRDNVRNGDATLWFGNIGSPGYWCTRNATVEWHKKFYVNPTADEMRRIANIYVTLNIAGNRQSTNPAVVQVVKDAFKALEDVKNIGEDGNPYDDTTVPIPSEVKDFHQ